MVVRGSCPKSLVCYSSCTKVWLATTLFYKRLVNISISVADSLRSKRSCQFRIEELRSVLHFKVAGEFFKSCNKTVLVCFYTLFLCSVMCCIIAYMLIAVRLT